VAARSPLNIAPWIDAVSRWSPHEHAIAEHDPSFRLEWRSLAWLAVGDDVGAEVFPFAGCQTEPASQLLARPLGDRRVERIDSRHCCGDHGAALRRV
jgi:hypothetical protein